MDKDAVSLTLPVIGKSKSTGNAGQRGTMAALFSDLVSEEELLESQTPKIKTRHQHQPPADEIFHKTASTTPTNEDEDEDEASDTSQDLLGITTEINFPLPPASPGPSTSKNNFLGRNRTYSVDRSEALSVVSQMTACLAIDVGLAKIQTLSDVSQMTARAAISIGLAKRKSNDISNDYNIDKPGSMEAVLAATITTIALENALKKTAVLTAMPSQL
jgi:hypothetical protein